MIKILRISALLSALSLSACGFHPVYGSHNTDADSPTAMDLNNVSIEVTPDRKTADSAYAHNTQILRNNLIDRMYGRNRPEKPRYHLIVHIRYSEQDLGIQANATSTRELLDMYGDYSLTDSMNEDGIALTKDRILITGSTHSVASFDKLDQMYGTVASRQDAYERTLHEVSEQIVNRISLFFSERP